MNDTKHDWRTRQELRVADAVRWRKKRRWGDERPMIYSRDHACRLWCDETTNERLGELVGYVGLVNRAAAAFAKSASTWDDAAWRAESGLLTPDNFGDDWPIVDRAMARARQRVRLYFKGQMKLETIDTARIEGPFVCDQSKGAFISVACGRAAFWAEAVEDNTLYPTKATYCEVAVLRDGWWVRFIQARDTGETKRNDRAWGENASATEAA